MKRIILSVILFSLSVTITRAQDVFDYKEPVTWLGLDFSELKFIKADEIITERELQDKYFPGWNELVLNEPKKYDIVKASDHDDVSYFTDAVNTVNKNAKGGFITDDKKAFEHLDNAKVQQMVKKYDLKGKTGLGLVFIVEAMDKGAKEASIWVTFINMATKEVLLAKPVVAESGGFGFRNYWAATFYKVMKNMPSSMKKWKKDN
jgi:hypothetical protein